MSFDMFVSSLPKPKRGRRCGGMYVVLGWLMFAVHGWAAEPLPVFTNPEVTAYVKAYTEYTEQCVAAALAAKKGDTSKMSVLDTRARELRTMTDGLAAKLRPEETDRFTDYLTDCAQRVANAFQ